MSPKDQVVTKQPMLEDSLVGRHVGTQADLLKQGSFLFRFNP